MQGIHTPRVDARYWTAITLASVFGGGEASTGSSSQQSASDPVSSIFANALTQIQTDLA